VRKKSEEEKGRSVMRSEEVKSGARSEE